MKQSIILVALVILTSSAIKAQSIIKKETEKKPNTINKNPKNSINLSKVAVWDTYVTKKDGNVMHFDIIAPQEIKDTNVIYHYGKEYLKTKGQEGQPLTSKECRFCHIETVRPKWEAEIRQKGYFIIEMENCE
ncbi:MAG: DUF2024 family protein [Saprospiraceae bacterium]|nr:DUF2024 family protein [Saprospiraceae bacterium]MBX7179317.1 DUF2024 family protein [Saprospiraceae bacterium]MCB0591524.1 DUF2024 family protein [Saprospiraceae bacterium]MCO5282176.1 DUF2024 family protein [Saprospiraceae bacterium]MCO6471600.1 DUF2024 family protein [Saprospiraceae bacterium]